MLKVSLAEKFSRFSDHWSPKITGELNDSYVKLVKFSGEFVWHQHEAEDELFLVVRGTMRMKYRDGGREIAELVGPGEFIIMPRGMEHCPASATAGEEVSVLLLEPKTTLNTGNVRNQRTVAKLDRI